VPSLTSFYPQYRTENQQANQWDNPSSDLPWLNIDELFKFLFPYFRVIEEQQLTYSTHSPENSFEFVKIDDCENFDIQVKQEKMFHPIM
jgi:hypothetical protein